MNPVNSRYGSEPWWQNHKYRPGYCYAHPICAIRRRGGLMFCCFFYKFNNISVIFVRPIISTSTGPIFTEFAGLVELRPQMNDRKLFFSIPQGTLPWQPIFWAKSTFNTHLIVRMTFARAAPPAYDLKRHCCAGRMQTNYLTRWTQANQLIKQIKITNRRRGG